jgi:hypothetical protein
MYNTVPLLKNYTEHEVLLINFFALKNVKIIAALQQTRQLFTVQYFLERYQVNGLCTHFCTVYTFCTVICQLLNNLYKYLGTWSMLGQRCTRP